MRLIIATVYILVSSCTIAADFSLIGKWNNGNFEFAKNYEFYNTTVREFGFDPEKQEKYERSFPYLLRNIGSVSFLNINNIDYIFMKYENKAFRIISEKSSEFWFRNPKNNKLYNREFVSRIGNVTATSELRKGNTLYSAKNLINGNGVWASSRQNLNEIKIKFSIIGSTKGIFIGNGFLSFKSPNLYNENSRAQKIRIKNELSKKELEFTLKDTIQPQYLLLSELMDISKNQNNFEIYIDSIYKGSKFNDLCLWELRSDNILE